MMIEPTVRRAERSGGGFTLVEMLLVVLILSVLAMAAIPAGGLADDQKLDALQLQIADALQFARSSAYQKGAPHGVLFGDYPFINSAHAWFAVVNEMGVPVKDPLTRKDYVVRIDGTELPRGLVIEAVDFGPRPLAAFDEKGVLYKRGEIHIGTRDTKRWLAIEPATMNLVEIEVGN